MSHNHEFHMWKEHVGHSIEIKRFYDTLDNNPSICIACDTCKKIVEIWEFIPEYEEMYEKA